MNQDHDPVDSALNMLRSDSWTAQPNPQLEEKLMQEFSNHQNRPRAAYRPALAVALGVLLIGGGAFAATGGIAKLKSWIFRVNINGQEATLIANEGEPATMTIQGEDGKTTHIAVMKASSEDGEQTRVEVNATADGTEEQQKFHVVRRTGGNPMVQDGGNYTVADLGDAQPNQTWTDDNGNTTALYVIPSEDKTVKIFHAVTDVNGQTTVKLVAAPRLEFDMADAKPQVSTDENGLTTMVFDNGDGEKRVMKFKFAHGPNDGELPADGSINIKTEDGQIQVQVNKNEDQD